MSEPLSQQIAAFRESIVSWRHGVRFEPGAVEAFDELFEGWERDARRLERAPLVLSAEDLETLGALTQKINAMAARSRGFDQPQLKAV
jgi:hypothetical protein